MIFFLRNEYKSDMFCNIAISDAVLNFINKKKYHSFHKISSILTVFNVYNNTFFFSTKSAYYSDC